MLADGNFTIGSGLIPGILTTIVLLVFRKKNNGNNIFLALVVFCISYTLFVTQLHVSKQILNIPALIRTANITGYLLTPFFYLYTRRTLYPNKIKQWRELLLFVPCLFYIIDMVPFFLSSNAHKIEVTKINLGNQAVLFRISEGWIGVDGFHVIFRYVFAAFILGLITVMLVKKFGNNLQKLPQNQPIFYFIVIAIVLHLGLIVPGILGAALHFKWYSLQFISIDFSLMLWSVSILLMFSPSILYGLTPYFEDANEKEPDIATSKIIADNDKFAPSAEQISRMAQQMAVFMQQQKPFLNPQYTIHDFGKDLNLPVYQLSPVINQHFQKNFNSWLNMYRVEHFLTLWETENKRSLTLDALAKEAGFTNRVTFTQAFKKEKNSPPGIYLKNLSSVKTL